jgi:hypothetical protein
MWTTEHSIETTASAEAIRRLCADVPGWPDSIADIAHVEISGPFAVGQHHLDDADRTGPGRPADRGGDRARAVHRRGRAR